MAFEQHWAGTGAGALDREAGADAAAATSTRLNGVPDGPGPGGGAPDLVSTPAQKSAAARTIETELEPGTRKAGDVADAATGKAVSGFTGWATAAGLKTVQETWEKQVKTLNARLASEKGALRAASTTLTTTDMGQRGRINSVRSNFDTY
ncbi:hypothetical protein [Streptomyces yaizuensis]|uniref:Uncharacterized protein n=1 Tax=Streptomyces yaizuensis TaxID=2989713 RepID=A0ABQ5NZ14_9ACTN|nr:hypothetical protein [Streptomyces sp. YSPA8]GLF95435.1 hypothetical protein SYYSPA8_14080 [Streptomyces sp. YSPA8]